MLFPEAFKKALPSTQLPGEFLTFQPAYYIPLTTALALLPALHNQDVTRRDRTGTETPLASEGVARPSSISDVCAA